MYERQGAQLDRVDNCISTPVAFILSNDILSIDALREYRHGTENRRPRGSFFLQEWRLQALTYSNCFPTAENAPFP